MRLGRFMLGLGGIMCVRLVWDKTTAFHSGDALLTFMLWLGLLEGAAALVLLAARPAMRERVAAASRDTRTRAAFGTLALGMLTPAILVLWLNQGLDASPGKVQTPVVGAKWVNSGRSGRTCLAYVTADLPSFCRRCSATSSGSVCRAPTTMPFSRAEAP